MPTNNSIDRDGAEALIPEDVAREIVQSAPEQSAILQLARRLPNMTRAQQRMPVLSVLPQAYFVTGDTGLKQTTKQAWANKYLNAEEIAVISPIPEAVLDDSDYDIWAEVRPRIITFMPRVAWTVVGSPLTPRIDLFSSASRLGSMAHSAAST